MKSSNMIAGLGGALVLTLLNESLKNVDRKMPRVDLVGEEALARAKASSYGQKRHRLDFWQVLRRSHCPSNLV